MMAAAKRREKAVLRMVDGLPKTGALVVVHAHSVVAPMRRLIAVRRGADVARSMRVVVAARAADEAAIAEGTELPVHRDPFVLEQRAHLAALEQPTALAAPIDVVDPWSHRA